MSKSNRALYMPYTCLNCDSDSLVLITTNNSPIKYRSYLDSLGKDDTLKLLEKYNLYKFRCEECKKVFSIDWSSGLPRPTKSKVEF